jgi:beta-1,4-mannosyltransferase
MDAPFARGRALARFPPPGQSINPCLDLLDEGLANLGVTVVSDPELRALWLLRWRGEVGLVHFHWRPDRHYACLGRPLDEWTVERPRLQGPRSWLKPLLFAGRLSLARALGYRIAWTIHEVYPTETELRPPGTISRRVDRVGGRLLARFSDVVLAHDEATAQHARSELGLERVEVVPHGSYVGVYPSGRTREAVRAELGVPAGAFVYLCFGDLRPDKGLDLVLDAFGAIPDAGVALVVAGRVKDPHAQARVLAAGERDGRIRPVLGLVPHERVAELFGAADAAVLGRGEVWTSGSMILALSLGVPVVAARLSAHEELLGAEAAGWLFEPGDRDSLGRALQAARRDPVAARAKAAAALTRARRLPTWNELAEAVAALTFGSLR